MQASDLIRQAVRAVESHASPWRDELENQLRDLEIVAYRHETWVTGSRKPTPPKSTALGHKPKGVTVLGHETQTDAALMALECGD